MFVRLTLPWTWLIVKSKYLRFDEWLDPSSLGLIYLLTYVILDLMDYHVHVSWVRHIRQTHITLFFWACQGRMIILLGVLIKDPYFLEACLGLDNSLAHYQAWLHIISLIVLRGWSFLWACQIRIHNFLGMPRAWHANPILPVRSMLLTNYHLFCGL